MSLFSGGLGEKPDGTTILLIIEILIGVISLGLMVFPIRTIQRKLHTWKERKKLRQRRLGLLDRFDQDFLKELDRLEKKFEIILERLERVEILYRGLTDIDENIKFECDAEGRLVYGNDNLYHLFNATEDELLGEGWANFLHPDSLSMLADWKRQVETNKIAFGSFKIIQRGTGDVYEISYKAKIYRDKKSDQPLHVVGQSTAVQIKE